MILAFIQTIESKEDQDLAGRIFTEQISNMKRIAYSILHNDYDTEDAVMNAVKSICQNIQSFESYDSPETLMLISIYTKNAAIDIYRKNKRNSEYLQSIHDNIVIQDYAEIPENFVLSNENTKELINAIKSLDQMYRDPLLLKCKHGMKYDEIARILNIDAGTVAGRIFRARKQLLKILNERGEYL